MEQISGSMIGMLISVGVAAGVASGLFGIGGGVIIVPAMILLLGLSQRQASAVSLVALLLPVGIFAVLNYLRAGELSRPLIYSGLIVGGGIAIGALLGSFLSMSMSQDLLKRLFAIFLVIIALKTWFDAKGA